VERLEVKRFGWVLGRKVRCSIPCYEALELVDPGNVIEEEKLREWEEMGICVRAGNVYLVKLWRSDLVPEELKQRVLDSPVSILRSLARLLTPIHRHRLNGYVHAYYA